MTVRLLALTALSLMLLACGRAPYAGSRPVRIAVMPFSAPESITGQTFSYEGWWFGSTDVRQNRNVGAWVAESLARQLDTVDNVVVVPPYDLRRYLLEQARTLKREHPEMTDAQIDALMRAIPLSDYGRDLEVDKIVTGQIFAARTAHNRTIDTWASTVEYQVQIWDVVDLHAQEQAGREPTAEWERRDRDREWFGSWLAAADELGQRIARELRRTYFSNPLNFRNL
ncbi:MAG: hypothetical protein HUU25_01330 [Candidatus Sumerlaeia bacterium]|nr:hypothetical protein [Candidatus Sumerlaeia bacterium]